MEPYLYSLRDSIGYLIPSFQTKNQSTPPCADDAEGRPTARPVCKHSAAAGQMKKLILRARMQSRNDLGLGF